MLDVFIDFELSINSDDVMDEFNLKPSKELGDKINALEKDKFVKMLN